jgi:hypothetical protein
MTLGVRPIKEVVERMSRTNGSGKGFFSPNSVAGVTTRVSTVDNLQQRS